MAADLAGRWITTDSGQHVFIRDGGGSVAAQLRTHFIKTTGNARHPDINKPVTEHAKGVNPAQQEVLARYRRATASEEEWQRANKELLTPKGSAPAGIVFRDGKVHVDPRDLPSAKAYIADVRRATEDAERKIKAGIPGSAEGNARHGRAEISQLQAEIDAHERASVPTAHASSPPTTLREQAARARPNAAIKAAQPGYREGATTLRDKIASQKALREQAELHRVNPKNRARTSEGLWEQRRIEREAMAAAPSVAHSGGRVVLGELRAKIEAEKEPFDKAMIRAAKRGKVSLYNADNPLEARGMEVVKTPSGEPRHLGYFGERGATAARAKPAPTLREQAAAASPPVKGPVQGLAAGHAEAMRAKVGTALATGSPTEQLGRLHNLKGENTAAAMRAGGSTVETRAVHAEIQGHMDRLERTVASKTPTLREMAASVRTKPSGSELEHDTAKEIAANKRVPLKGQSDFTEKVRTVSTSEATGTTAEERKRMEFKKARSFAALKREQFPYRNRLADKLTAREQAKAFALRTSTPAAKSRRLF